MCGIAAVYSNDQNILGKIDKIIKKINYRGPDDMGSLQLNKNFSVGSCRLSIFDVSEKGKMPMKDSSNNYTIVYNGEIYNFPEIKKFIFQQKWNRYRGNIRTIQIRVEGKSF